MTLYSYMLPCTRLMEQPVHVYWHSKALRISGLLQYIGIDVSTEDSTLSYLPLAHVFDRVVEEFALYSGARIGYYQVGSAASITLSASAQSMLLACTHD